MSKILSNSQIQNTISRYNELSALLSTPSIISDVNKFKEYSQEQKFLEPLYQIATQILSLESDITSANELLKIEKTTDMIDFLITTSRENEDLINNLAEKFIRLSTVLDKDDFRSAIVEIRAGTGGEEAALFAGDLHRMYLKYAEKSGWKVEHLSTSPTDNGGFKEVIIRIDGKNAYGKLKHESGVHRVQRVPATEAAGRIHTSAASVVVLPEVEDKEVVVDDKDIKIDVFRAGGPGGQSVNTTDSAVRITHLPSGLVVSCQDEKSQLKNKARAMSVLKSRLYEIQKQNEISEKSKIRQQSIKGGDRSAKIRTYNYPQNRITDHRIKHSWHNIEDILNGNLDEIITSLSEYSTEQ